MLWKLMLVALLAVGVTGRIRSTPGTEEYEAYTKIFATEYCNTNMSSVQLSELTSSIQTFAVCVNALFDRDTMMSELAEATKNHDYTEIFKTYCAKTPGLKACFRPFYAALATCQTTDKFRHEEKAMNYVFEYACENNGAKLARFFKEDGEKCFDEKRSSIASCIESNGGFDKIRSAALTLGAKVGCKEREQVMTCLVQGLKECQNPAVGDFAKEFREVVLKSYDCPLVAEIQIATVGESKVPQSSEISEQLELLKKRKLELEVRNAEIETWNRENELNIKHTVLTAHIKHIQPFVGPNRV